MPGPEEKKKQANGAGESEEESSTSKKTENEGLGGVGEEGADEEGEGKEEKKEEEGEEKEEEGEGESDDTSGEGEGEESEEVKKRNKTFSDMRRENRLLKDKIGTLEEKVNAITTSKKDDKKEKEWTVADIQKILYKAKKGEYGEESLDYEVWAIDKLTDLKAESKAKESDKSRSESDQKKSLKQSHKQYWATACQRFSNLGTPNKPNEEDPHFILADSFFKKDGFLQQHPAGPLVAAILADYEMKWANQEQATKKKKAFDKKFKKDAKKTGLAGAGRAGGSALDASQLAKLEKAAMEAGSGTPEMHKYIKALK